MEAQIVIMMGLDLKIHFGSMEILYTFVPNKLPDTHILKCHLIWHFIFIRFTDII